jgi:hypothetical protein
MNGGVQTKAINLTLGTTHPIYIYIQGVTGGKDQTSGECSLC